MSLSIDHTPLTAAEVGARGRAIYSSEIQSQVEPQFLGKYLTLDIFSHDWEVGDRHREVLAVLRQRQPRGRFYTLRIGFPVAGYVGSAG